MGQGVEAGHPGNLAHVVFTFLQKVCGTVELVALEEHRRVFSGEALYLVVELGAGNLHHFRHVHNVKVCVGQFFLHEVVELLHEGGVAGGEGFGGELFRGGDAAQLPVQLFAVLQQRFHEGHEVGGLEWLGDVGIGPLVQALHLALHGHLGGDQHYRDVGKLEVSLDAGAQLVAVHAGHHDVGDDEVCGVFRHSLEGRFAVVVE